MSPIAAVPCPPAFLDPLTDVQGCYYYAVPKFFGQNHPSTRWLINMIKNSEEDRLKHKMETSPYAFKGVYYQMMDYPQVYLPADVAASPMFKRQAVTYLTPLGMAIYLGKADIVHLLLTYKDLYDQPICDPNEPQYATHLQDNEFGDFHAFPPFVVMLRRSCFGCAQTLMRAGWDPSKPVAMPMRRKFERRVLYFRDWLEVALSVLATRPMYTLQVLVRELFRGSVYKPVKMPLTELLPATPADIAPVGLIDVDELPPGTAMTGVRSLLDMAEHYDRYLQMRRCAREVADLKREAVAVGLNPEVLMIQAQDFDGGDIAKEEQTNDGNSIRGANNSSAAEDQARARASRVTLNVNTNAAAKKGKADTDPKYVSEGCRILHFALMRDPTGKSMQTCLEAFCVLLRRDFYLQPVKPGITTSLARDLRNTAYLLLNLVQREQSKVDKFVEKIKSGVKKFAHLEEHKQLENRKTACIQFMSKLVAVLTRLLLHAKLLVDFIQADFPPYNPALTNIRLNPYLAQNFQDIKFGSIREFNLSKDAWIFLDKEMLRTVSGMPEMQLHMKVGKRPANLPKSAKKAANKNKSNMINTNSCFVSYTRVQRQPKPSRRAAQPMAYATPTSSNTVAPYIDTFTAAPLAGEESSAECLLMESSADLVTGCTGDFAADLLEDGNNDACPDSPTMQPTEAEAAVPKTVPETVPDTVPDTVSDTAPEATAAVGESSGMELLLASLCREVGSLFFRPLEDSSCDRETRWAESAGGTTSAHTVATRSSDGAALGLRECSTIEPEPASTPIPSPEPSPDSDPAQVSTALSSVPALNTRATVEAASLDSGRVSQLSRRQQPQQLPPGLRRKLKQSGVLQRLISRRQSVKDCAMTDNAADAQS